MQAILTAYVRAEADSAEIDRAMLAALVGLDSEKELHRLKEAIHREQKKRPSVERPGVSGGWNKVQVAAFLQHGQHGQKIKELVTELDLSGFTSAKK